MKQKKKTQQENSPRFGGKIRQMKTSKIVLVSFTEVEPFTMECAKRGITLGFGSTLGESIIAFQK